jgi:hypothetical protein
MLRKSITCRYVHFSTQPQPSGGALRRVFRSLTVPVFLLSALAGLTVTASSSGAQPPPPGPSWNCAVYQNIYAGPNNTVIEEQRVYHCNSEAYVGEDLYFLRGSTTLKAIHKDMTQCNSHSGTLSNCVRDYTYSFSNPAGSQTWGVCADVVWSSPFGKIAEFKSCTRANF